MQYNARGLAFISCEWILTATELIAITLRLYSRTFLTRSVGSDDFFITIGFLLNVAGEVSDLKCFLNGWSQHENNLTPDMYAAEQKWEFTAYIIVYIAYFFIRASVMLFVLRLLPSYKKWQQKVVYSMFLVNFAVTLYTCITFGVSCIPFKANWDTTIANAKCFSNQVLVITNQINAALACACDITTALIPQFLLWNVQMKVKTKRQLNVTFGLGLITALLSIGRAATTTKHALAEDTTWRMIPSYYFTSFECQLGILIACGPAIRQFWGYRSRTHTSLPTKHRQSPNEDFKKMRYRINLRDIFWYREARMVGDRVFDAAQIFQSKSPPPDASSSDPQSSTRVSNSALDVWEKKIKYVFAFGHDHEVNIVELEPLASCTRRSVSINDFSDRATSLIRRFEIKSF
ncbi:MAG: hypothetical protein Q9188_004060 [Gyalolechia gomerana]